MKDMDYQEYNIHYILYIVQFEKELVRKLDWTVKLIKEKRAVNLSVEEVIQLLTQALSSPSICFSDIITMPMGQSEEEIRAFLSLLLEKLKTEKS